MAEPLRILAAGATSAIAQAVCREYAARGARFFLVARNAERLRMVADDLVARGAGAAITQMADLAILEEHAALVAAAVESLGGIDVALIAHGVLPDQARCEASFEEARRAMHVNFTSPASLAATVAARLEGATKGTLVVIGSVAGDRGRRSNYVYGAAKAALATFLGGLRHRLHASGVRVITVKPGLVDTPMTADFPKGPLWSTPDRVAAGIVRATDRGRSREIYVPGFWRLVMWVVRALPEAVFVRTRL